MTKDEFYEIAAMRPEMPERSIYRLTLFLRDEDDEYVRNDCGVWEVPLTTAPVAFYSCREEAEKALKDYRGEFSDVHSAIVERIPVDGKPGAEPIAWWLYDAEGRQIDHSVCSAFHYNDNTTPAGRYLGRYPEEIRFKKGDFVEVIVYDRKKRTYIATPAVVNSVPGTIEDEWRYFNLEQEKIGEYPLGYLYRCLGYFHDSTDNQYGYLTGCGGDNTLTYRILPLFRPLPKEIAEELEQYPRNYAEWQKCIKKYELTEAESRMLLRGEMTEETLGTLRRMTKYLRRHPGKEIEIKKTDGKA